MKALIQKAKVSFWLNLVYLNHIIIIVNLILLKVERPHRVMLGMPQFRQPASKDQHVNIVLS